MSCENAPFLSSRNLLIQCIVFFFQDSGTIIEPKDYSTIKKQEIKSDVNGDDSATDNQRQTVWKKEKLFNFHTV